MREYGVDRPWDGWVTAVPLDDGSGRIMISVFNRGVGHDEPSRCRTAVIDGEEAFDLASDLWAYTEGYGDHDDREPGVGVRLPEGQAEEEGQGEG